MCFSLNTGEYGVEMYKNKMCHMTCFCINITPQNSEPWRNVLICPVRKLDCIKRFSVL